jgi:putative PIN family toxin of toxin-antitoxin system
MITIFDTNVLLNVAFSSKSVAANAFQKALMLGDVVYSPATLAEFTEVLNRPKFDKFISNEKRNRFLKDFAEAAISVAAPCFNTPICKDPKDEMFLELAVATNADYIISLDKHLLVLHPFQNTSIIKDLHFLHLQI